MKMMIVEERVALKKSQVKSSILWPIDMNLVFSHKVGQGSRDKRWRITSLLVQDRARTSVILELRLKWLEHLVSHFRGTYYVSHLVG